MKITSALFIFVIVLSSTCVRAVDAIDTDGPDFVESSETVPLGRFQYELDLGAAGASKNNATPYQTSTPLLLKYGIAPNVELRLASDGISSPALGIKWHTQDRDFATRAPAISWILHVQTTQSLPSVRSVITWELADDYALGLMPGMAVQVKDNGQRYVSAILGAVVNKKLSDKARVFAELAMSSIAKSADGGVTASGNLGWAYLLSNDTQLGAKMGVALNDNAPKRTLTFEIAQRF